MTYLAVLVASLIGSPHCAGMCGGFAIYCCGQSDNRLVPLAGFHLGRLISYSALGAVTGILGAGLDLGGTLLGFQRVSAILCGALLLFWGIRGLTSGNVFGSVPVLQLPRRNSATESADTRRPGRLERLFGFAFRQSPERPGRRSFILGNLTGCLPCGWLWSFLALAAASGGALQGVGVMFFFWLGTVPILSAVGVVGNLTGIRLRRYAPAVASILLIFAGLWSLGIRGDALLQATEIAKRACH